MQRVGQASVSVLESAVGEVDVIPLAGAVVPLAGTADLLGRVVE